MSPEERFNHEYLGDGVYVEYDGFSLILRTGSHLDSECDHKIYLEREHFDNLKHFVDKIMKCKNESREEITI